MKDSTELLNVAAEAAALAREIIRTRLPGQLTPKGDRDYATEVDFAIERELRAFLAKATPTIGLLGEEEGATGQSGTLQWALDPVDGTINFAHSLPLCGVSLALVASQRPVLGVIDLPFLGCRYTAVEGEGAFRDGEPIRASAVTRLHESVVSIGDYAVDAGAEGKNAARLAVTARLARSVLRVRMFGSAAIDLAWLAEGKTDAAVTLSNKPWDTAAGVIIAREAGALVVDDDGTDHTTSSRSTIAAAPGLVSEVVALVQQCRPASYAKV